MSDRRVRAAHDGDVHPVSGHSIDELLDRAVAAINRGDRSSATALAARVLVVDVGNAEAEDLLAYRPAAGGEIRRLTILFADLVDSTVLSTQVEPETYRLIVGRYQELVQAAVDRFEGHVPFIKGDGLLAVFGYPTAHENDVRRAVLTGLQVTREVAKLSAQAKRRFGVEINVRVGVHRGMVYLDTTKDDVYGLAVNLAARVSGLAPPGTVVVSDAVAPLVEDSVELQSRPAAAVKGVDELIAHHLVLGERAAAAGTTPGPLVGRERELSWLEKSWARAQAGTLTTPGLVFRGEPGMGKSRLAAAAIKLAEMSGAVVELAGSPFHTDAGLHPVRAMLESRCGIDRSTEPRQRLHLLRNEIRSVGLDPATAVPLLAPVLGIGAEAGYEPVAVEGRKLYELITEAVQTYLLACLGEAPGLVVAEDVHWFDPSTREVLGAVLNAAGGRLLLVATGRPGEWLPAGWPHEVFDLRPLTDAQTDALIGALNPGLTANERAAVAARCDGVPFYIEQVVNGLSQTGVPEALYEPLFARLRATAKVVPVVEAAAVIGRVVDRGLLCAVVDMPDDDLDEVLDELADAQVLEPWQDGGWRFRHELLREVAAELAPPSVRRGLHAKVANALIGAVEPEWALVAGHYERAERFDEAAAAYQQASADARLRGALAEARAYLTRGLAQLDHATAGPDRDHREVAVRLERGNLTSSLDGYQSRAAAADFERCLQLSGTDLRNDELFATLAVLPGYYVTRGDMRGLVRVIESLRTGLEQGRPWFRPVIEMLLGWVAWLRGEFDAAVSDLEAATASLAVADQQKVHSERFRVDEPLAYAHIYLASARLMRGDLTGAESELAHAARRAETLGFPLGSNIIAYALTAEIGIRIEAGQVEQAAVLAADLSEQAERHDFDEYRLWAATLQAAVGGLAVLGADDVDQAVLAAHITALTDSLDVWRTVGLLMNVTFYDAVLGRLLIAAGQLEAAGERLDAALVLAQDTGMCFYDAELLRLRAQTRGDPGARQADISAALALARRQGATLFELRAALDDFELRGRSARASLTAAVSLMPTDSAMPELARARAAMS